ncbi:MAG TPA: tetratricopeptide repeat protein, partial [Dysgonamonadaceae bacterium]|nr:tetratricopeptide repeat protein [Dysgonamonadaceae bacterium]
REVMLLENPDEIFMANRARISSIRATWKEGVDYSSLIAEVKENNSTKVASPKKDFEFVIDDSRTYHQLSDFKNANARNLYVKAINLQKQLESVEQELSDKRDRYAQAGPPEKNNLAPSILALEKEVEALHRQIDDLFVQSRNTEIRNTF